MSVLSKRVDGYHNLETCFFPVRWLDVLEIIPSDTFSFTTSGNAIPGNQDENICIKAYALLQKDFDLKPVKIHLHKIIPSGAGLGGGSSDAAYTLRLLNDMFDLKLPTAVLMDYASKLGSDCAFFIQNKAMLGTGRGELLTEISPALEKKFLVVVKPDIHVSTADAFAGINPGQPAISIREVITQHPLSQWKDLLRNDFEYSVFKKYPSIKSVKEKLYALGAIYASMSGSGSAVYGIFDSEVDVTEEFPKGSYWSGVADATQ